MLARRELKIRRESWTTPPSLSGELLWLSGTRHAYRAGALMMMVLCSIAGHFGGASLVLSDDIGYILVILPFERGGGSLDRK
jgi:hypothetical protein